jgi:dienelactone hydrolase
MENVIDPWLKLDAGGGDDIIHVREFVAAVKGQKRKLGWLGMQLGGSLALAIRIGAEFGRR